MRLIAGLGNPGPDYRFTRHNAGFMGVDFLLERYQLTIKDSQAVAMFIRALADDVDVGFIKPMSYMNRSGPPIRAVMDKFDLAPEDLLVIHDDIDLDLGDVRYKEAGGHAGHNGVRSIIDSVGSRDFYRIRIGVDRSGTGMSVVDHVLGEFEADEKKVFTESLVKMADFVETRFLEIG